MTEERLRTAGVLLRVALLILLGVAVCIYHQHYRLAVRNHNLQVFAEMMACNDHESTDADKCAEAVGKFMMKELGLFDIHND